ncbi:MAG: hypothetical protein LC753_01900 [Acidobacteria bacterium]|nr:hypothetical protein [Acidobacteriota bacterium]MCA1649059.1 hypothetical protein [Acidobacteriota bacterium]
MRRFAALIALFLLCPGLEATVLIPAEFREVVSGSQIIAYGRVVAVTPEWADGRKRIDSLVTFQVGTYLKGNADQTITFRVPGGQLGAYRSVMVGAPVFAPGDEAVLFFAVRGSRPHIFGLNQGVFRVRFDSSTGRRMVVQPPLLARGDAPELVIRGATGRRPEALESFAARVRTVMAELAGGAQ